MSRMIKRVIFLLISYCIAISSFGQNEWDQTFEDLYSMAQFTHEVLVKVQTMPAKESLVFLDSALDTLKAHHIGGLLPSLLYSTKIEKGIEVKDTTNVLTSLRTFRDYVYNDVSEDLRDSFNYGFGKIRPSDNSWIGESYFGIRLYRQGVLMACCAFPETAASQFGIEAMLHSSGVRLFADNNYKYACQTLAVPEADSLHRQIERLQYEYKKWEDLTPMNAPTLQLDYTIVDFPERKVLKDSIEAYKQDYLSIIYQDNRLLQQLFTNWIDIKNQLKDTDKAIVFAKVERKATENSQYIAFVIDYTYDQPKVINICNENQLIEWENDSHLNLQRLFDIVWQPINDEISASSRIYFSTDGLLHKLPIENALTSCPAVRLSSLRSLTQKSSKHKLSQASLFGGLSYSLDGNKLLTENDSIPVMQNGRSKVGSRDVRYGVKELTHTKAEVIAISNILQKRGIVVTTYTGENGTEEAFRTLSRKNIDILHIATHGFFWTQEEAGERNYVAFLSGWNAGKTAGDDASMLRSGLLFSGANVSLAGEQLPNAVEDGVLTAQELSSLDLENVELVVMSACDTGLGEVNSEGVFGLQRGFKLAGAKSLLMSLWKVDDEATKVLMTEFYRYLLDGKSKTESLRLAQEYVKSQPGWNAPEYWAGFILLDALD